MLLELVSRAVARTRTCLPAVRCSSTLRGDQDMLQTILEEEEGRRGGGSPNLMEPSAQRSFKLGLFIRPHYFTHKHRFTHKTSRTAPPLVAPGRKEAIENDVLHHLGIDPLWEISNPALLGHFITEMGKIKPRTQTRVTTKTQRKVAKAIRRAKMMGTIPLFYHPKWSLYNNKKDAQQLV